MEKFMLLFRGSDVYQPGQSPETAETLKQKMVDWVVDLSKKGIHVASEPFYPAGRLVNGTRKIITETPFGENREIIGGCTIVQAENINEATEIAKACPILQTNATIEIRPIQKIVM